MTSDDKPKEFILEIKLLLQNAKFVDQNLGLAPLTNLPSKQTKIIVAEDKIPSNFTHLGQYAFTLENKIFEKKMNWKEKNTQTPNRDNKAKVLRDPVVYFTIAIATDLQPRPLIDGIRMEWKTHEGGKLQVKDLQSHESKVMFALYFVYIDTPFHISKKTLKDILHEVAQMLLFQRMLPDDESIPLT
jgi:hypothetical protein